jgi:hypothetical protein
VHFYIHKLRVLNFYFFHNFTFLHPIFKILSALSSPHSILLSILKVFLIYLFLQSYSIVKKFQAGSFSCLSIFSSLATGGPLSYTEFESALRTLSNDMRISKSYRLTVVRRYIYGTVSR